MPDLSAWVLAADLALVRLLEALPWRPRVDRAAPAGWRQFIACRLQHGKLQPADVAPLAERAIGAWRPRFLRLHADALAGADENRHAAQVVLEAAKSETLAAYRIEQIAFAGAAFFASKEWAASEQLFRVAHDWLSARPISRWLMSRLWHYVNYFLWCCRSEQGDVGGGLPFLRAAIASTRGRDRAELRLEAERAEQWLLGHDSPP